MIRKYLDTLVKEIAEKMEAIEKEIQAITRRLENGEDGDILAAVGILAQTKYKLLDILASLEDDR